MPSATLAWQANYVFRDICFRCECGAGWARMLVNIDVDLIHELADRARAELARRASR
jgi:hypothetical protein